MTNRCNSFCVSQDKFEPENNNRFSFLIQLQEEKVTLKIDYYSILWRLQQKNAARKSLESGESLASRHLQDVPKKPTTENSHSADDPESKLRQQASFDLKSNYCPVEN